MNKSKTLRHWTGGVFAALAGFVALAAIVLLALNVSREMKLLQSAQSDNVQWSLSQVEVEFLELTRQIAKEPADVAELRRRFDVFYSRISIIEAASVFETLRADVGFADHLQKVRSFLDTNVGLIDQSNAVLRQSIPALDVAASAVRSDVRGLSNSGLNTFAKAADLRRNTVARTMSELAVALVGLIGALACGVVYLNRLNARGQRRQMALKNAMRRINTITSTSLDGVIISDLSGRILEFNPAAEKMFGHWAEDVIGRELGAVIIPDHLRSLHDAGMERMRQGGTRKVVGQGRVTLEANRSDGQNFPIELAIQSAETEGEEIFIAFLRDISERVAAESELVEARDNAMASEKAKTEFLATMSHEIRTPLNGLLGNMTLLSDTKLNSQQVRYLENMETSGRLLMSHVSDVLDITRYDAGKLSTRNVPMNISRLLQDIIDNQSGPAATNETTLEWGWKGEPVNWVQSDPDRLQHILMNLIGNAVKFTKRGKVTVTVEADARNDPTLRFDIIDTGSGIDPNLINRIFDDFVTGNTAYNRDVGGTGLGLSIAKRFTLALGGEIAVNSFLEKGSQFIVSIPLHIADELVVRAIGTDPQPNKGPLNILVVEDNEINRVVAREMLLTDGHNVTEAFDGREGVQKASLKRYDLIFMDISMPILDGRAATRKIRGGAGPNAATTIIALTANAMADEQEQFLEDGMNGILTKPLSRSALRELLDDTQPAAAVEDQLIVDQLHSAETRDAVGPAGFEKLIGRFAQEVNALLDWLSSAAVSDLSEVSAKAHKIAGSAAVFGAVELREILKEIEAAGQSQDAKTVAQLVEKLPAVWQRTKPLLL